MNSIVVIWKILNSSSTQCMNVKYSNKTLQAQERFEHSTFCLRGRRYQLSYRALMAINRSSKAI